MKIFKTLIIASVIMAFSIFFNDSIAQMLSSNTAEETLPPRQQLVVNLLKQEITQNKAFAKDKDAILETLSYASREDAIGDQCYKYSPLLVNALNSNATFVNFFDIQGNYKYAFKKNSATKDEIDFSFYEWYDEGEFVGTMSSVSLHEGRYIHELENKDAIDYITENYCDPLNQALDQNKNLTEPQLLAVLRQIFSK